MGGGHEVRGGCVRVRRKEGDEGLEMSAGRPITGDGLRLRKKKYYSFPSVNHTPPPGNVEKKGKSEKWEGGKWEREV